MKMEIPSNCDLPFFAYGLFKLNELASNKILSFIDMDHPPTDITIKDKGCIFLRDGLPLLNFDTISEVKGYIIRFKNDDCAKAYDTISKFVDTGDYKWHEFDIESIKLRVNSLIGVESDGFDFLEETEWRGKNDPIFNEAMSTIAEIINEFADHRFPKKFDEKEWSRFFKLQMAYLLLWSTIERYGSFAYGLCLMPHEKKDELACEEPYRNTLEKVVKSPRGLHNPKWPDRAIVLRPSGASNSIRYYYQVRNNIVHRGKGEGRDGDIVQDSLIELFEIFKTVLAETLFIN